MSFVHLKARSHYSLQDGLGTVDNWLQRAVELGYGAMAITERDNLFSAVKFYRKAIDNGIKPVIGVDVNLAPAAGSDNPSRVVLLCMNIEGMRNINRMLTAAWKQQQPPLISRELLEQHSAGLIALSGLDGELATASAARAAKLLPWWQKLFPGSFCLAIQRVGLEGEENWISRASALGLEHDIPLVATNDCRFVRRENYEAHSARVCVLSGETMRDNRQKNLHSDAQYLRSAEEMRELFADIPSALENTMIIAKRCNLELEFDKARMPRFPSDSNEKELLQEQAHSGLDSFLKQHPKLDAEVYKLRLEEELKVVLGAGYAGYFLIVADFIRWAHEHDIPVGPGRGSGGGSLVAFVTGITSIDPMEYDLLFERFLNPERVSLPDFDIDFCMNRRDDVINYVSERYGRDRVAQIITYGAMNAKAVIRDVVRILGQPYMLGDRLARQVPAALDMTLDKALKEEPSLRQEYEQNEEVRIVIDLARQLEGSVRHPGRHAGGIVISPEPLVHYMPLYSDGEGEGMLTQFDMHDVEAIGLVKFDFLGLKTLTVIDSSLREINRQREAKGESPLRLEDIPKDDDKAYSLLREGHTLAVFQLESFAMKRLINGLQPTCFDDMVALVALMRPGPLESGMTKDYIERKHGRQEIRTLHPMLKPVLRSTYGVVLYQEQVMEIARTMSGYSLGGADMLRRAMGKKKREEMEEQKGIFVEGAVKNNVRRAEAERIFSLISKFAGYGFNKSHSVAYALISYHTAWLKAHYTAIYMAAALTAEQDNVDRMVELRRELKLLQVPLLPPDINCSLPQFTASSEGILYSLAAIRGVGRGVVNTIIRERDRGGKFTSLHDLCCRLDQAKCNRRVLETLAQAGALDSLGHDRATLFSNIPRALALSAQIAANQEQGSVDMFGLDSDASAGTVNVDMVPADEKWSREYILSCELQVLGDYFSGHPVQLLRPELRELKLRGLDGAFSDKDDIAFVAEVRGVFRGKGGFMDVLVEDEYNRAKVRFNQAEVKAGIDIPKPREMVYIRAKVNMYGNDNPRDELLLRSASIHSLEEMYAERAMLLLDLRSAGDIINQRPATTVLRQLRGIIANNPGSSPVVIRWQRGELEAKMKVGDRLRVRLDRELLRHLEELLTASAVQVRYHSGGSSRKDIAVNGGKATVTTAA